MPKLRLLACMVHSYRLIQLLPVNRWLNYDECVPQMQEVLLTRGKGERVQQFKASKFLSFADAIKFWNENVRIVLGMHGGGLYNVMWSSPQTPVIEFRPQSGDETYGGTLFWELSSIKNLTYWTVPVTATSKAMDAVIDCSLVAKVLHAALEDKGDPRGPTLDSWYQGRFQPGF